MGRAYILALVEEMQRLQHPHYKGHISHGKVIEVDWLYTADQIREYARAAIQQAAVPEGLPQAVLALNTAWNRKEPEEAIAGHMDLCRRLALAASPAPPKQQPALGRGDVGGVPKYDPRMRFLEKEKGTLDLRIEGLSMRKIKDIFEFEYGEMMWSEGCAYPSEKIKLQFIRADLTPTGQINPDSAGQGMEADHG